MKSCYQETGACCVETNSFHKVQSKTLGILPYDNDSTTRSKLECSSLCLSQSLTCQHFLYDSVKKMCLWGTDLSSTGIQPTSGQSLYSQSNKYCDVALGYDSTIMRTYQLCLKIVRANVNFSLAKLSCSNIQGQLVMVKSNATKESIVTIMEGMNIESAWVGIDDIQSEGTYVWSDGSVLTPEERSVYISGQPDNNKNNQDCTVILQSYRGLDDYVCSNNEMY
ncbi:brevican core protein [Biomphalaria pfeifferi]|uniref:Brevican core protein n=1 Tax=Biomphalaria pfeifferi TaxID=112525 RepID=A0AAD8C2B5_BIOPF|nr:brevican core protein [Biomphalaria pfeifferi]